MVSSYVLDSSSLFTLFFLDSEENVHKILKESSVLDLTGYEIGSILTKGNDGHIRGLEKELILDLTKEIEKVKLIFRTVQLMFNICEQKVPFRKKGMKASGMLIISI